MIDDAISGWPASNKKTLRWIVCRDDSDDSEDSDKICRKTEVETVKTREV